MKNSVPNFENLAKVQFQQIGRFRNRTSQFGRLHSELSSALAGSIASYPLLWLRVKVPDKQMQSVRFVSEICDRDSRRIRRPGELLLQYRASVAGGVSFELEHSTYPFLRRQRINIRGGLVMGPDGGRNVCKNT
jgi:hypothetical protein